MKIYRNLKISKKTLLRHRMRTVLALLGIIVGVSVVIVMVAIGNGARAEIVAKIEDLGTNLLIINPADQRSLPGRGQARGLVTTLTAQDADAVRREIQEAVTVVAAVSRQARVKYGNLVTNTSILGTAEDFPVMRNFRVVSGWFFTDQENRISRRVAVLGHSVGINLFEDQDPVGRIIRIGRVPFEIIGVMEPKGVDLYGTDQDDQIFIPLNTALRRVFNQDHITAVYIQVDPQKDLEAVKDRVRSLLRRRHGLESEDRPDDFIVQSQSDLIAAETETTSTFTSLTAGIAGISLIVGGIGILAVMLLSIRERRQEIGLRLAVGARPVDVRDQFLFEAVILSVGGGVLGMAAGLVIAFFLKFILSWMITVSAESVLFSFAFSLSAGLFFGVYPAHKASLLDPVVALRSE